MDGIRRFRAMRAVRFDPGDDDVTGALPERRGVLDEPTASMRAPRPFEARDVAALTQLLTDDPERAGRRLAVTLTQVPPVDVAFTDGRPAATIGLRELVRQRSFVEGLVGLLDPLVHDGMTWPALRDALARLARRGARDHVAWVENHDDRGLNDRLLAVAGDRSVAMLSHALAELLPAAGPGESDERAPWPRPWTLGQLPALFESRDVVRAFANAATPLGNIAALHEALQRAWLQRK